MLLCLVGTFPGPFYPFAQTYIVKSMGRHGVTSFNLCVASFSLSDQPLFLVFSTSQSTSPTDSPLSADGVVNSPRGASIGFLNNSQLYSLSTSPFVHYSIFIKFTLQSHPHPNVSPGDGLYRCRSRPTSSLGYYEGPLCKLGLGSVGRKCGLHPCHKRTE